MRFSLFFSAKSFVACTRTGSEPPCCRSEALLAEEPQLAEQLAGARAAPCGSSAAALEAALAAAGIDAATLDLAFLDGGLASVLALAAFDFRAAAVLREAAGLEAACALALAADLAAGFPGGGCRGWGSGDELRAAVVGLAGFWVKLPLPSFSRASCR